MKSKIFRFSLTVIVLLNFSVAFSQDYAETAMLFSRTRPGGSARILGVGGSQIALGGDYSSALSNPAGLGMFNKSEFTVSTALSELFTSTTYLENHNVDGRTVLNIPGISLVLHLPREKGSFLGGSFAVTLSRTNDFNQEALYRGFNENNSIVDYFISEANGTTTDAWLEDGEFFNTLPALAYDNYLIGPRSILNPPGSDDEYFTDVGYPDQQEEILIKGATNQWSLSYGGNVNDKYFFGAGLGISSLRYKSEKFFSENYDNPEVIEFMHLNENLDIRGSGINATFGGIVRPVHFMQLGVSYTTPTFYNLTETYKAIMSTRWNNFDYYGDGSVILGDNTNDPSFTDQITSDYNLTTPSKSSLGIAFIWKFGFLTGDVELTNPAKAKYGSDTPGISYSDNNQDIRNIYKPVVNYRIGTEFRYKIFRVRSGYGVQSNTYRRGLAANNMINTMSGGVGIRTKKFFIDFALSGSVSQKYLYQPYTFPDGSGPVVSLRDRATTGIITAGFTF